MSERREISLDGKVEWRMKKQRSAEKLTAGTWIGVKLSERKVVPALVARYCGESGTMLLYVFPPGKIGRIALEDCVGGSRDDALTAIYVCDNEVSDGVWPILGLAKGFSTSKWPIPWFMQQDPITDALRKVKPSEESPVLIAERVKVAKRDDSLEEYGMHSSSSAVMRINEVLKRRTTK
jgi:hypothetical protein